MDQVLLIAASLAGAGLFYAAGYVSAARARELDLDLDEAPEPSMQAPPPPELTPSTASSFVPEPMLAALPPPVFIPPPAAALVPAPMLAPPQPIAHILPTASALAVEHPEPTVSLPPVPVPSPPAVPVATPTQLNDVLQAIARSDSNLWAALYDADGMLVDGIGTNLSRRMEAMAAIVSRWVRQTRGFMFEGPAQRIDLEDGHGGIVRWRTLDYDGQLLLLATWGGDPSTPAEEVVIDRIARFLPGHRALAASA